MNRKRNKIHGIKYVDLPETENLFTSYGDPVKKENSKNKVNSNKSQEILSRMKTDKKRAVEVVKHGKGIGKTKRAMENLRQGSPVVVFNTKSLGEPSAGDSFKEKNKSFSLTQFAFSKFNNLEEMKEEKQNVHNVVLKQSENVTDKLLNKITELEKNPLNFYQLEEEEKSALSQLVGFSDESLFGGEVEFDGKTYRTLNKTPESTSPTQSLLTKKSNLKKMRRGIENMSSENLTTSQDKLGNLIDSLTDGNPVFIGQNTENYGQLNLEKHLRTHENPEDKRRRTDIFKPQPSEKKVRMPQSPQERINKINDSILNVNKLSSSVSNRGGNLETDNYGIGSLYSSLTNQPYGVLDSNNASDEVKMTTAVASQVAGKTYIGKNNEYEIAYPKDKFNVRKGTNTGTKDTQYDMVTKIDPKTGKHIVKRSGKQAGVGRRARSVELIGEIDPMEIDGIQHQGITLYDEGEEQYHHILRKSKSAIDDIFNNSLVPEGQMSKEEINYIKQDRARRTYLNLFSSKTESENDTVQKRLESAYGILIEHDKVLEEFGADGSLSEIEIMKKTRDRVNEQKDGQGFGLNRVEDVVFMKEKLLEEQELWLGVVGEAKYHSGTQTEPKTRAKRQNLYVNEYFNSLVEQSEPGTYGHPAMQMLKLDPLTLTEEVSYRGIDSEETIKSFVEEEINKDIHRFEKGQGNIHTKRLFGLIGKDMPEKQLTEMTENLESEIRTGRIKPKTVDSISNALNKQKGELETVGSIVNEVIGLNMETPLTADLLEGREGFKNSKEFKENLRKNVDEKLSRNSGTIKNMFNSKDFKRIAKESDERKKVVQEGARYTNRGMTKSDAAYDIYNPKTAQEQIEKTVRRFEKDGFQVRLDKPKDSDRIMLFATPNQNIDFSSMNFDELDSNKEVFQAVMPLIGEDYSIDTMNGSIRNVDRIHFKNQGRSDFSLENITPEEVRIDSSDNFIYQEIQKSSSYMKKALKDGVSVEEVIANQSSGLRKASTEQGTPAGHTKFNQKEKGFQATSRDKNRNSLMDMNAYMNQYAKENRPDEYAVFEKNRHKPGHSDSFLDYIWGHGEKNIFKQEIMDSYTEKIGNPTGVNIHADALSATQIRTGTYNTVSSLSMSAVPFMNKANREQTTKIFNYRELNRDPLDDYFEEVFGEDSLAGKLATQPAQNKFQNMVPRSKEVDTYQISTLRIGDEELDSVTKKIESRLEKERDAIKAKPNKLTVGDISRLKEIEEDLSYYKSGFINTFEDEYMLSEVLMKNIKSDEHMEIGLNNYEMDPILEKSLKESTGLKENEQLKSGRHMIKGGIQYKELEEMGLVDEHGTLTIGTLEKERIFSKNGDSFKESKRRHIQADSELSGVDIDKDGQVTLLLNNRYQAGPGYKTLGGDTGVRETAKSTAQRRIDDIVNELGIETKNPIQAIKAFEKTGPGGRGSTSGLYGDVIRTSADNVAQAIDEMYTVGQGQTDMLAVNEFFTGELSGDKVADYKSFMDEVFIPDVNEHLGEGFLTLHEEESQQFEFSAFSPKGTPEERQEDFKKLHELAKDKYGFISEDKYAVTSTPFKMHDIAYTSSTGSKAKFGRVEMTTLEQLIKGPTAEQTELIRDIGYMDGVEYVDFNYEAKLPGESIVARTIREQSKAGNIGTGEDRRSQEQYARTLRSSVKYLDEGISEEDVQGNILIDAAGKYTFGEDSNYMTIGEGEDAYTVVDGSSINLTPKGMPSGAKRKGTYSDLASVNLYNEEDKELTIGDLAKQNESNVFVQIMDEENPLAEDIAFENNIVQAIPFRETGKRGDSYQTKMENTQTRAFEAAHKISYEGPGNQDPEQWLSRNAQSVKSSLAEYKDSVGNFLGNEATKEYDVIERENSLNISLSGRNIMHTEHRVQDFTMNEKKARQLIGGRTQTILDANQVSEQQLIDFSGMSAEKYGKLKGSDLESMQEDYIIDRISGAHQEDDGQGEFEVYQMFNRNPTQDEGSILFGTIRVVDGKATMDPRHAGRAGGDFDGDKGNSQTYFYKENETKENAIKIQRELKNLTKMSSGLSIAQNHNDYMESIKSEGKNQFIEATKMSDSEEIKDIFADHIGEKETMLEITSGDAMSVVAGTTYNRVGAAKEAVGMLVDTAMTKDSSPENVSNLRALQSNTTALMSNIQENSLSKKKMRLEESLKFGGYSPEEITQDKIQELSDSGELKDLSAGLGKARAEIPGMIEDISSDSVSTLQEMLERTSVLTYGDDDEGRAQQQQDGDTLQGLARVNDSLANSGFGGFGNKVFKTGFRSSNENKQGILDDVISKPGTVPQTDKIESMVNQMFGEDSQEKKDWLDKSDATLDNVIETFFRKGKVDNTTREPSSDLIEQLARTGIGSSSGDKITSQSDTFRALSEGATDMLKNDNFKVAAGVTAAWMLTRAMSKGPTPEGNDAEREQATPQEIAPAQLLTSPTARVTPGAEAVSLDISGDGNLSQAEAATIVNNEVQSMTQMEMNMNINVSDNTNKLDNRFYQSQVDKVFGI